MVTAGTGDGNTGWGRGVPPGGPPVDSGKDRGGWVATCGGTGLGHTDEAEKVRVKKLGEDSSRSPITSKNQNAKRTKQAGYEYYWFWYYWLWSPKLDTSDSTKGLVSYLYAYYAKLVFNVY